MANEVDIVIRAIDQATGPIDSIGKALGGIGVIAAGVVVAGIGAATAALGLLVEKGAEAQDVQQLFNSVLKSSPLIEYKDQLLQLADAYSKTTRFEDENIISAETVLLRYQNLGEDVMPLAIKTTLNLATLMGTDATTAAQQLGKSLEDIAGGSLTLLARTRLLTKEQIENAEAMAKSGDTAKAQAYVLDILDGKIGNLATDMGQTFAGRMEIFRNTLQNIAEDLGMQLLPALEPLLTSLTNLATRVAPLLETAMSTYIVPFFTKMVGWVTTAVNMLATFGVGGLIRYILGKDAGNFVMGIVAMIGGIFTKIQEGLAYFKVYGPLGFIQAVFGIQAYQWVVQNVLPVLDSLVATFRALSLWWQVNGPAIMAQAKILFDAIVKGAQQVGAMIGPFLSEQFAKLTKWFVDNGPLIQEWWRRFVDIMVNFVIPVVVTSVGLILKVLGWVVTAILSLVKTFMNFGITVQNVWKTVLDTVLTAIAEIIKAIQDLISWIEAIPKNIGLESNTYRPPSYHNKASGGLAEGLTMVGEMGPELVRLPRGSYVHNAGETAQMMGGGTIVFNFPNYIGNAGDLQRAMEQTVRQMQRDGRVPS